MMEGVSEEIWMTETKDDYEMVACDIEEHDHPPLPKLTILYGK